MRSAMRPRVLPAMLGRVVKSRQESCVPIVQAASRPEDIDAYRDAEGVSSSVSMLGDGVLVLFVIL
jgi:hypothetical protein